MTRSPTSWMPWTTPACTSLPAGKRYAWMRSGKPIAGRAPALRARAHPEPAAPPRSALGGRPPESVPADPDAGDGAARVDDAAAQAAMDKDFCLLVGEIGCVVRSAADACCPFDSCPDRCLPFLVRPPSA